jgi:hypothetical protein
MRTAMASVSEEDARSATAESLYKAIAKNVEDVADKDAKLRAGYLKDLAEAYALVTFGRRQ